MADAKHTPGPWMAGPIFKWPGLRGIFFQDHSKPGRWQRRVDREANGAFSTEDAMLIAAAPELLEALQDVLRVMEQHEQLAGSASIVGDEARAAIAKATGSAQ